MRISMRMTWTPRQLACSCSADAGSPRQTLCALLCYGKIQTLKNLIVVCGKYLCLLFLCAVLKIHSLCSMRNSRQLSQFQWKVVNFHVITSYPHSASNYEWRGLPASALQEHASWRGNPRHPHRYAHSKLAGSPRIRTVKTISEMTAAEKGLEYSISKP